MTNTTHTNWIITTEGKSSQVVIMPELDDAIAWCEFDNFGGPLCWLVDDDGMRSIGPYSNWLTNRGYCIAPIEWNTQCDSL